MRFHVSAFVAGAAASTVFCAAAAAQSFNVACVKGADERTIEIVSPGLVGATCDVQYARAGGMKTPYHANNSATFCEEKAGEIVAGLIGSGFACGPVGGPLTAEARPAPATESLSEPEPAPALAFEATPEPVLQASEIAAPVEEPAETTAAEDLAPQEDIVDVAEASVAAPAEPEPLLGAAPIEEPFPSATAPEEVFEAAPLEPITAEDAAPEALDTEDVLAPVADAPEGSEGVETDTAVLTETDMPAVATRGPATLAGDDLEELQRLAEPIPSGRLVGAAPAPEPVASASDQTVSHATQSPAGGASPAATTPTPAAIVAAAPAQPKSARPSRLRDPEEVIVATLNAQAAAWNEGNLQAFMETYWNDDDLKFVSGTAITKGWSPTMKRYRERYADEAGLGQLFFEKTDVEMVTDDVAVVTGRFNHVKDEEASSGVFTLVMKRVGGVWRIVHDHTAGDAPKTQ